MLPFRALLPAALSAGIDEVLGFLPVESHSLARAHFSTRCLSATCAPVWSNRMEKTVTHAGKSFVSWDFCLHHVETLLFLLLVWSAFTSGCWKNPWFCLENDLFDRSRISFVLFYNINAA